MKKQAMTRKAILLMKRAELRRKRTRLATLKSMLKGVTELADFLKAVDAFGPLESDERIVAGQIYSDNREKARRLAEMAETEQKVALLLEGVAVINKQ